MRQNAAIELSNITKRFGKVVANDGVNLTVRRGEVLAILGENGSGKTTLMNMISGIYFPDEGKVSINGREVSIRSPRDAYQLGIGMVHQHFMLVDVLTAAENIVLGLPGARNLNMKSVYEKINALTARYGFELDPAMKIYDMSVSQKQTVEIVKVLYRGADILILDEPTAVLTPQETERLFDIIRTMRDDNRAIIIITHKLNEVLEISDRVFVMRKGKDVGTVDTRTATVSSLTELMVGKKVNLDIERPPQKERTLRLAVEGLTVVDHEGVRTLSNATFKVYGGEILGIAGVAGSGQRELLEAIAGLQPISAGQISYYPPEAQEGESKLISNMSPSEITKLGIRLSFVPEDRLGMGLVGSMSMTDNMMLRSYRDSGLFWADRRQPRNLAENIVRQLEVHTPGVQTPVSKLSGGNVQKVLVGREIALNPTVLMVAYPVRGLDINSSYTIYRLLNEQKKNGVAVVCVGEDLDVLLELCDNILVLCGGRITGIVNGYKATKEKVGMLMTSNEEAGA